MNERYEKKFELPELERRKLKMLELKESHKRLTIDELLERGKKYDQEKLEKEKKRKEEQENRLKDFHFHPSYKSENYQKVKEETTKLKHFKENEVK